VPGNELDSGNNSLEMNKSLQINDWENVKQNKSLDHKPSQKMTEKEEKKLSKVQDLLRQSRENAFNMNKQDLDRMFNL
jgi:hypothetical protein